MGHRTLLMNLMETVDPLFKKTGTPIGIYLPTQLFHIIFEELTDTLELLCILTRS